MFISLLSPIFGGFRKGITNNQKKKKRGGDNFAGRSHRQSKIEHPINSLPWVAGQGVAVWICTVRFEIGS